MEESCGWCKERDSLWLSTGDGLHVSSSSSQQMDIRVLGSLHIWLIHFTCMHATACKSNSQQTGRLHKKGGMSDLNSRFHWELFTKHTHTPRKRPQELWKKKDKRLVCPRLILCLFRCWSQAKIFATVSPVHLLITAHTWQTQQRGTLINIYTGYVQPTPRTLHLCKWLKHVVTVFSNGVSKTGLCRIVQQGEPSRTPPGESGGWPRRHITSSYTSDGLRYLSPAVSQRRCVQMISRRPTV